MPIDIGVLDYETVPPLSREDRSQTICLQWLIYGSTTGLLLNTQDLTQTVNQCNMFECTI